MIEITDKDLYYLKKEIKKKYGYVVRLTVDSIYLQIDFWTDDGLMFNLDLRDGILSIWNESEIRWNVIGNSKKINP